MKHDLFKEFGNIFNPKKDKLSDLKQQAYDLWIAFSHMTPEHDQFYETMKKVEDLIWNLEYNFGHFVEWEKEFTLHSDKYYDQMTFKVLRKMEDIENNKILTTRDIEYKLIDN